MIYASGTGTLIAVDEVDLGFKSSGQVTKISVAVGDTVKAGDGVALEVAAQAGIGREFRSA